MIAHETEENTGAANVDAKRPVQRRIMRKVDFYWSDRWQRVINIYRCSRCGGDENDLSMNKPEIERTHVCA